MALALDESEQWLFSASADKVGKHSSRDTFWYLHNTHAAKDGCGFWRSFPTKARGIPLSSFLLFCICCGRLWQAIKVYDLKYQRIQCEAFGSTFGGNLSRFPHVIVFVSPFSMVCRTWLLYPNRHGGWRGIWEIMDVLVPSLISAHSGTGAGASACNTHDSLPGGEVVEHGCRIVGW